MLLAWRNHSDVRRFMLTQHEIKFEEHLRWFQKSSNDFSRRLLLVEEAQIPIGYVQFTDVKEGGVADWGFYARPNSAKGTGRKIGKTALNYAFGTLNLHKVCGQALEKNEVSVAFHQRLGFKQEALLRDQKYIDGEYYSIVCFGLLSHEWRSLLNV
jgi:UDP-4-amino-4,6-dideoxy-N-acetyl-beta-L-altrosamine N-acetyltransferase